MQKLPKSREVWYKNEANIGESPEGGNEIETAFNFIRFRRNVLLFAIKAGESSNGRTTDFGSVYLGSSPSSPALNTNQPSIV